MLSLFLWRIYCILFNKLINIVWILNKLIKYIVISVKIKLYHGRTSAECKINIKSASKEGTYTNFWIRVRFLWLIWSSDWEAVYRTSFLEEEFYRSKQKSKTFYAYYWMDWLLILKSKFINLASHILLLIIKFKII